MGYVRVEGGKIEAIKVFSALDSIYFFEFFLFFLFIIIFFYLNRLQGPGTHPFLVVSSAVPSAPTPHWPS